MFQVMKKKLSGKKPSKSDASGDQSSSGATPNNGKPNASSKGSAASGNKIGSNPASVEIKDAGNSLSNSVTIESVFAEPLPSFRDIPSQERQNLFVLKLNLCCYVFDFTDPGKHTREKEIKRQTLLELVDYVNSGSGKFTEAVFEDITKMLVANLFRTLPPSSHENSSSEAFDPEEEDPTLEPAWPHLQIVFEFLLRYVVSSDIDAKVAKKYIDQSFVLRLLDLFDSEDPRERDYLKTILHRIYGKFMVHRPFIRKAINNIFYRFIFETERHNGIAELLEILGSIINGFALPLKDEHKQFLERALIPLHKPKCVAMYHQQLSYCITQFVEKDPKLSYLVIRGLLKYWPLTNSQKEVLFLGELEEVLELTQLVEFQKVMEPLFRQIGRCLNSSHFQVAERALFLWNNDYVVNLVNQNIKVILPLIFNNLEKNACSHWNQAVHGLTVNVKKLFQESDKDLYGECQEKYLLSEQEEKKAEEDRQKLWKIIEETAKLSSLSHKLERTNITDGHMDENDVGK